MAHLTDLPVDLVHEVYTFFDVDEVSIKSALSKTVRKQVYFSNTFWFRYWNTTYSPPIIAETSKHIGAQTMECFFATRQAMQAAWSKGICQGFERGRIPTDFVTKATTLEQLACIPIHTLSGMLGALFKGRMGCTGQSLCEKTFDVTMMRKVFERFAPPVKFPDLRIFSREMMDVHIQQSGLRGNRQHTRLDEKCIEGLRCFHKKHYTGLQPDTKYAVYNPNVNYRGVVLRKEKKKRRCIKFPQNVEAQLQTATRVFQETFRQLVSKGTRLLTLKRHQSEIFRKYHGVDDAGSLEGESLLPALADDKMQSFLLDIICTKEQRSEIIQDKLSMAFAASASASSSSSSASSSSSSASSSSAV